MTTTLLTIKVFPYRFEEDWGDKRMESKYKWDVGRGDGYRGTRF
jgi:hypothetical protein